MIVVRKKFGLELFHARVSDDRTSRVLGTSLQPDPWAAASMAIRNSFKGERKMVDVSPFYRKRAPPILERGVGMFSKRTMNGRVQANSGFQEHCGWDTRGQR